MTHAQEHVWTPWTPERRQVTTLSGADGRRYDLMIATPAGEAPPDGWPCLVVLDGDRFFEAWAGAAEALSVRRAKTGVGSMVVAGVRYVGDDKDQRSRDFTSSPSPEKGPDLPHGEAEAFREFLIDEVIPEIAKATLLDEARLSLFGHSLAGLFVLETLQARPEAFARWISISPSLWWRTPDVGIGGESLLLGVGEKERARDMADRVSGWAKAGGAKAKFVVAPGADHGSAPFALMPEVLRHATGD